MTSLTPGVVTPGVDPRGFQGFPGVSRGLGSSRFGRYRDRTGEGDSSGCFRGPSINSIGLCEGPSVARFGLIDRISFGSIDFGVSDRRARQFKHLSG